MMLDPSEDRRIFEAMKGPTRIARMTKTKRGYSREFRPHGETGKRYLLDKIPAGLWARVREKAKREGISLRALILKLLTEWSDKV
jgi:hypothetical protein